MNLTHRGWAAAFACFGLLVASGLFADFILAVLLLLAIIVLGSEFTWVALVTRRPTGRYALELPPESVGPQGTLAVAAGSESLLRAKITRKVGGRVSLRAPVDFIKVEPSAFSGKGASPVNLRFSTPYSGEYKVDSLPIDVAGPLGLVVSSAAVPLSLKYVVHPRVLSVAAESMQLLAKARIGESPINAPGVGTEFYEMREYVSGDDYRHVNWKATARQNQLLVNQGMKEVGGAYVLALDAVATGYSEADTLSSTFLSMANSLATAGISFGLVVHESGRVTESAEVGDPISSLVVALRAALNLVKLDTEPELMELLPARLVSVVRPRGGFGGAISEIRAEEVASMVKGSDSYQWILGQARKEAATRIVYVSGLTKSAEAVIELGWQLRRLGNATFVVASPLTRGPEDDLARRKRSLLGAIRAAGIECYTGGPLEVASLALMGQP